MMQSLVTVSQLSKTYGKGTNTFRALKDISFTIEHGEFVGIMGPSGSGKSTLLNVLATIDTPTAGDIHMEDTNIAAMKDQPLADFRRMNLGFIFQDYNLLDSLTVKENILLPLAIARNSVHQMKKKVQEITETFEINTIMDKYPYEISGGQKQRTAACRALISDPKLLFADEPTGALDSKSATDLLERMQTLNQTNENTILMVTHDPFAASFCRRILFLEDGQLSKEIFRSNQSRKDFYQNILNELAEKSGSHHDTI